MTQPMYVYYHTHWDREWYLPFREYQHRLLKVIDTILETVEQGKLDCFTLDGQTVLLEDYLEFRPQNRARLEKLIQSDRISIGPWYVMPDEFLISGESLIRNLERGLKISESFGEKTFTGYLPDTFGHTADIPMVLAGFGIHSAIVWRGISPKYPLFEWESPSGDQVLGYHLTEGYFQNVFHMGKDLAEKQTFVETWQTKVGKAAPETMPVLFPVGADHLGLAPDAPDLMGQLAPQGKPVTPDTFMALAEASNTQDLSLHHGELRDHHGAYILPGVFSSRLYLKQWNRRLEWRLTQQLEQLLTWQQLLGQSPVYALELEFLWKTLMLNHPHDSICGCSVDSVHRENEQRFEQIDQFSAAMVREAHHQLNQRCGTKDAITLYNLSDTPYTGVIEISQDYPLSSSIPDLAPLTQCLSEETILDESYLLDPKILPLSENKALRRKSLVWADNLPAHSIVNLSEVTVPPDTVTISATSLENASLHIQVGPNGELTVVDKATQKTYSAFHQLVRNAEQGDSYNAAPVPDSPQEIATYQSCKKLHEGPLRGALRLTYCFTGIKLPIETDISLDAGSNQVMFTTRFTNNTVDHKIQALFTAHQPITEVVAEGHFSPVTRTYDPAYRIEDAMPAPPQKELLVQAGAIQRFIGFDNQTLVTEGLTEYEVEGNQLKLTLLRAFGMLSRSDTGVRGSHAGPPLPTPEGQCLNRPAEYRYAWAPGFEVGQAFQQAERLYGAIYGFDRLKETTQKRDAEEKSFLSWDNPTVQATAIIPGENHWRLRLLNPTSTAQSVQLSLSPNTGAIQRVTLRRELIETLDAPELILSPYELQTLAIQLK